MVECVPKSHADKFVSGTIGFGRQIVIFFLQCSVYADSHCDGFVFFRRDNKFFHNAFPPLILNTL